MVKQLISGILGKKEDSSASKDEVPDELPPLAESIVAKAQAESAKSMPRQVNIESSPQKEMEKEVPEELPALVIQDKSDDFSKGTLEDLEKDGLPDEIKKAKLAKTKIPESAPQSMTKDSLAAKDGFSVGERIKAGAEAGFFSNILEHIKTHGDTKERLLAGDLFSRMGNYWDLRKHEIKTGTKMPAEKKIEDDLLKKLEELKILEQKWQIQKLALEEDIKFIHEREREIQAKIKELSLLSNELALFRNVKPEEYFFMHNGVVLKNLHDLIDVLEIVDEETFEFHVKGIKNDFSDWIKGVFRDNNLSDRIKSAKSKMEMIEILEKMPVSPEHVTSLNHYIANPKKYFWLANGTLIRGIHELSDALKIIDDDLFVRHVNETKNDFASWVGGVLGNEHLAEKLRAAKTKRDMIQILELFL